MNKEKIIIEGWGKVSILDLVRKTGIGIDEIMEIALKLNLTDVDTPNIRRSWTKAEDEFLIKNSDCLSVRDASNLLYRSHYATYQRVRLLGLHQMINKK